MTDTRSTGGKGQPSTADTGTADPNQLAEDFGDLARSLEEHDDPDVLLAEIVAAAVAMVPGADEGRRPAGSNGAGALFGRRLRATDRPGR